MTPDNQRWNSSLKHLPRGRYLRHEINLRIATFETLAFSAQQSSTLIERTFLNTHYLEGDDVKSISHDLNGLPLQVFNTGLVEVNLFNYTINIYKKILMYMSRFCQGYVYIIWMYYKYKCKYRNMSTLCQNIIHGHKTVMSWVLNI